MSKKKAYPTKYYIRFIVWLVFHIVGLIYRVKRILPKEVKQLKSPYLLLCNHVGHWDPFFVGNFLPRFTHFVASDASMRSGFNKFFMTRLGTIPKKKNIRDSKVIRDIVSVIKQEENIGIFPEAVRNWAGTTMNMDQSIVKLIKMLNVPVIVAVLKGMNLFHPRWSKTARRTKIEVEYKLLFDNEQLKQLSDDEIFEKLKKYLHHDEVEYQREHMNKIHSERRAEHIGHALYVCPQCYAIDSFKSEGNDFKCAKCNYDIHIDDCGFFERETAGKLFFDNIRDWYYWQEKWMAKFVNDRLDNHPNELIFEDLNSEIYHTQSDYKLDYLGNADVKLFPDRIEIRFKNNREKLEFKFEDLQTISPQINERLEIYFQNEAYRIIGSVPGVSALKWEVAANIIWKKIGQTTKLVSYING